MKIEIEKSHFHRVDLVTENQLILQIEEGGISRHYMYPLQKSFSVTYTGQIEDERK